MSSEQKHVRRKKTGRDEGTMKMKKEDSVQKKEIQFKKEDSVQKRRLCPKKEDQAPEKENPVPEKRRSGTRDRQTGRRQAAFGSSDLPAAGSSGGCPFLHSDSVMMASARSPFAFLNASSAFSAVTPVCSQTRRISSSGMMSSLGSLRTFPTI